MMTAPARGAKQAATKQFAEIEGTPVLIHTLRKFAEVAELNEIFVALRKPEIAPFHERLEKVEALLG